MAAIPRVTTLKIVGPDGSFGDIIKFFLDKKHIHIEKIPKEKYCFLGENRFLDFFNDVG